jgi:hypothetical protein
MADNGNLARLPCGVPFKQRLDVALGSGKDEMFDFRGSLRFPV